MQVMWHTAFSAGLRRSSADFSAARPFLGSLLRSAAMRSSRPGRGVVGSVAGASECPVEGAHGCMLPPRVVPRGGRTREFSV